MAAAIFGAGGKSSNILGDHVAGDERISQTTGGANTSALLTNGAIKFCVDIYPR